MPEATDHPVAAEARRLMTASEEHRASRDPARLELAVRDAQQAIILLTPHALPELRRLLAAAWKLRGLAEEQRGGISAAVHDYDEAREIFLSVRDPASPEDQHELGSIWTHRGMTLLSGGTREDLLTALPCFDQAIALRRPLPHQENWLFPWALAASLMNRADTLTRLGSAENLAAAVHSYDEALAYLADVPQGAHPGAVQQRQAVAHMNRGFTLQVQKGPNYLQNSLESFDAAIALLRLSSGQPHPEQRRALASALVNRSNVLLTSQPAQAQAARVSAQEALTLLSGLEEQDPHAAEAGLKARHSLCRALAILFESSTSEPQGPDAHDWVTEMTDIVDDALQLACRWEGRGVTHLRPMASAFFRFGSRVFATAQPHFLAEFLLDHLDPERSGSALADNPEMHAAAQEALWQTAQAIQRRSRDASETSSRKERELQTLSDLQDAAIRLTELRQRYLEPAPA